MGAKIQQNVAYLLTEDEFWVGPDNMQNTGPGCKPELGKTLSTAIRFDKNRRFRSARCMKVGARAFSPTFGMSSTISTRSPGAGAAPKSGRRDIQLLGQLREVGQSEQSRPSLVAIIYKHG
jgi:hypothetical protein